MTQQNLKKLFIGMGITVLSVLILLVIALNSSFLQTQLVNYWLRKQTKTLNIEAHIQNLSVSLLSQTIDIKGFEVYDHHQNLLANVESLHTSVNSFSASHLNLGTTRLTQVTFRLHRYREDSVSNFQRIIDFFKSDSPSEKPDFAVKCTEIYLRESQLSYVNELRSLGDTFHFVDFNHVFLDDVNLVADNVDVVGDKVLATIEQLSFKEQKGFEILNASMRLNLSPHGIIARQVAITTPFSDLDLDLRFQTESWKDYQNFISDVHCFSKFRTSELNTKDLVPFAPALEGMENEFKFSGNFLGSVKEFQADEFFLNYGNSTQFSGNVLLAGLPDVRNSIFQINIHNLTSNAEDLGKISLPGAQKIPLLKELERLGKIDASGTLSGNPYDLGGSVNVTSNMGSIQTDVNFIYDENIKTSVFSGNVNHSEIALEQALNDKMFGNQFGLTGTFTGNFSAQKGIRFSADLLCENIEYQRKKLRSVALKCDWDNQLIATDITIRDSKGNAQISGEISIDENNPYLDFSGSFDQVNLTELQFLKDTNQPLLSADFTAKIQDFDLDSARGNIHLQNVRMAFDDTTFNMKQLAVSRQLLPEGFAVQLNCDFLNMNMLSDYRLSRPNEFPQSLDLTLRIVQTNGLLSYFLPDVNFPKGAYLEAKYENPKEDLFIRLNAEIASVFGFTTSNLTLNGNTNDSLLALTLNANALYVGETRQFENVSLGAQMKDDLVVWQLHFLGAPEQKARFDGDFEGQLRVLNSDQFAFNITQSELRFMDQIWQFDPTDMINIDHQGVHFQNIRFFNQQNPMEYLTLDGDVSKASDSRLDLRFNNYLIDPWMPFIEHIGLDFSGQISGDLNVFDIYKNLRFDSDLKIKNFKINDFPYGIAHLQTTSDKNRRNSYVNFDLKSAETPEKTYLSAKGYFSPNHPTQNFDLDISVPEMDLSFLKNYVSSFSSSLTGKINGQLALEGTIQNPLFYGELVTNDAVVKIDYLNTIYAVKSEKIDFSLDSILFRSASIEDVTYHTQGKLSGGLYHRAFKDFRFDLGVEMQRMFVLNTSKLQNEDFYGKAFASGNARILGDSENITFDVQGRTEPGTEISIPYSTKINVSENNRFIRFVSHQDTGKTVHPVPVSEDQSTRVMVKLNVEVTPDASFIFDMNIPPTTGIINASGAGNMLLNVDTKGDFTMVGDYVLQEGYYDFSFREKSLGDLMIKRFYLERGGTMQWTGDPTNMIMNISGVFHAKASLYPIISGSYAEELSSTDYRRKVNVQSVVGITGRMSQPNVKFDFRLPNVDENLRTEFFSILNRDDGNEMFKQTFSLLLFGTFTATGNNSNVTSTGSNTLETNASTIAWEMLSNQISNLFQNFSDNINFGVNLKPGDINSTSQTQLSMSSQFLDNRLLIDGQVTQGGLSKVSIDDGSDNWMSEVNVEYRFTDRFSAKAFNRSNERELRPQQGYSQGVGVSYKRDFDSFKALFRRKKRKKGEE